MLQKAEERKRKANRIDYEAPQQRKAKAPNAPSKQPGGSRDQASDRQKAANAELAAAA